MINEKDLRLDYFIDPQRKVFRIRSISVLIRIRDCWRSFRT